MWKNYNWNPATCCCKNGNDLTSIIDDSVITCDEIIHAETKSPNEEKNSNEKKAACKTLNFYILLSC